MNTFSLQLSLYLCRYDKELQLRKAWLDGKAVPVTEIEDELWADHEDEIRDEAQKHFEPDFGEMFQDNEQNRYQ